MRKYLPETAALVGFVALVDGVYMFSRPAAFIIVGLALIAFGVFTAQPPQKGGTQ